MAKDKSGKKKTSESFFEDVNPKEDFPAMEKELLDKWYEEGIVDKYLKKNDGADKRFSFMDGPITANNPMGVHHGWGRTYKDLWQRFFNMRGFKQRFQNGFDCQGLWVEVEVEKELGLKSKKDIENLVEGDVKKSIAKFVELCKKRVYKFADIQTEQSKRLGYFMDWDNSYFTLSDENNYTIWHFLKKCHEKDLIYKGRDSVPWCPRCGTAISQHEMLTEDYKEVKHPALYVSYPIKDKKDEHLLIWTTTPWTLPANVAVAVNKEIDYVLAENEGNKYYMSKKLAEKLKFDIKKKLKGKDLVGLTYESPFDELGRVKEALGDYEHRVVETNERILEVTDEEGTGLVHIATGAGSEDFSLGKEEDLPVIDVINEEAKYLEGLGKFTGKNAKDDPGLIIKELQKKEALVKKESYKHRYPACWRCKTELVWRVVDEWYISIDPVREKMKNVAKKINWIPEFGLKRELDWLNNMHDWLISKKRYWGLALPIWECEACGHFEVIGGKEELKERAVEGWKDFEGNTPHRPFIDEVKIKCQECGELAERIPDVGNPWLDAGIVPYSTITKDNKGEPLYWGNKKKWKKWFPTDFITESFPGQFKNWFYAMIAMSTVLENKEPSKTVLGFGTLLGEDGRAMHKSWGNAIEFNEGADKIGVDVMRWMYASQNPADNLIFGYKVADETRRRFHLKLWNVYNFFVTYANLDGWKPGKNKKKSKNILDKWLLSRLRETVEKVTKSLEKYDAYTATGALEDFVEDFSNWYIRRSRGRVGPKAVDEKDKEAFYQTSYNVLTTLAEVLSPFTPFMTEAMYKNLTKEESVHLTNWPKLEGKVDEELLKGMEDLRLIVEKVHAARKEEEIPVRQPLNKVEVTAEVEEIGDELLEIGKKELNIKEVKVKKGKEAKVSLDTKITPDLEKEAKLRDLIRKVQRERKKMGTGLSEYVTVKNPWIPEDEELIKKLKEKTQTKTLKKGKFEVRRDS